jgi:dienelactone hydrolase
MTSRLTKTVAATLATAALLTFPLSAFGAVSRPTLSQAAVSSVHAPRGSVVSAVPVAQLTAAQLNAAAADFPGTPPASYGVTAYRLIYRTIDHDGRPTTASGIVVLPDGRRGALTVAEYLHGTNPTKAAAASVDDTSTDRLVTALFAGQGLVGVAPDYLGLGLGPGKPPYLDTKTETSSSGDLLLAARSFAARHRVALKRDVLVTGFSQGGRASIAFGHALSRGEFGPFRLGAIQAVAGPYDLLGSELPAIFTGGVLPPTATFYLGYLVTAWNRTVGLYDDPREVFRAPYAATVEGLFDGTHSDEEIVAALPDSPEKLFTPAFIEQLRHPTGRLLRALRAADQVCRDWTPRVPVQLYSGTKDTDVVAANADACAASLRARGADVTVHDMGAVDHTGTAYAAYPQIIRAFSRWA